jgi:hypothetical protein
MGMLDIGFYLYLAGTILGVGVYVRDMYETLRMIAEKPTRRVYVTKGSKGESWTKAGVIAYGSAGTLLLTGIISAIIGGLATNNLNHGGYVVCGLGVAALAARAAIKKEAVRNILHVAGFVLMALGFVILLVAKY